MSFGNDHGAAADEDVEFKVPMPPKKRDVKAQKKKEK